MPSSLVAPGRWVVIAISASNVSGGVSGEPFLGPGHYLDLRV